MDFRFSKDDENFRQEVRDFIRKEVPSDWAERGDTESTDDLWEFHRSFQKRLATKGWLVAFWPKQYGGQEWPYYRQLILNEELSYNRLPKPDRVAIAMAGPNIIAHGTEEQKKRHLPPIANAELVWCQLFSEPNAGSDLAAIQTTATENGDEFIINGQKTWTTLGHRAQWGIMLARTNPNVPKHKGISYFLMDMGLPGVRLRPIIDMAGRHHVNEVFFDNVRVPKDCLLGEKNMGWYLGANTLNMERSAISDAASSRRMLQELMDYARTGKWGGRRAVEVNPAMRHKMAELEIEVEMARLLSYRVSWMQTAKRPFSHEAAIAKMFSFELSQRLAQTAMQLTGLYGQVGKGEWAHVRGKPQRIYLVTVASTIGGGTSEIQRTTIAQRGLGLPRGA